MSSSASLCNTQPMPAAVNSATSSVASLSPSASRGASHGDNGTPKKTAGTTRPLKRVLHTPQMVVKVRDCPSSNMPIELCYQCFGDPADGLPPVLLICGLNMQLYAWDEEFCESLVRAGFYVIRYDNRDMGHSTKVEHRGRVKAPLLLLPGGAATWLGEKLPYSVEDMAADAWALLDALHLPCAHLFGISMGGMIAQTAALLAPERTMSLTSVMSSTNAPDLPQPQLWVKLWMLRKPPRHCTVDELLEFRVDSLRRLLRSALPPDGDYLKKRFLMSLKRSSYSAGLVRQAATIRRAVGRDAALQHLYVPALVVHGAQDVVVPPMHGYRTATMLPYARMLVLKSMGHYFHPAFFSTIIEAFADMAASTDPAKRGLGSRLPSASSLQLLEVPPPPPTKKEEPNPTTATTTTIAAAAAHAASTATRQTEDGNVSAAAAWRRGGGSVSRGSHTDAPASVAQKEQHSSAVSYADPNEGKRTEAEADVDVTEASSVDPKTLMMASMGAFIRPVVADASSPIGMAACRSVMVAVPGGSSSPGVPEAVMVENMFLRNPHAVPSMPTATVVKRPVTPTAKTTPALNSSGTNATTPSAAALKAPSNATTTTTLTSTNASRSGATVGRLSSPSTTSPTSSAAPGKIYASPLAAKETKRPLAATSPTTASPASASATTSITPAAAAAADRAVVDGTTTTTLPTPLPMDGAVPYVPCSPSRWHEVAPFPQRSGNAKIPTTTGANAVAAGGAAAAPASSMSVTRAFPEFHPIVVGVPVAAYLDTHPMERETSGLAMTGANASITAAAAAFDHDDRDGDGTAQPHSPSQWADSLHSVSAAPMQSPSRRLQHGSLNEASWTSATALHDATPSQLLKVGDAHAAELSLAVTRGQSGSSGVHSSASRSSSQERRENESFLQAQAPEEVVEATALPSL